VPLAGGPIGASAIALVLAWSAVAAVCPLMAGDLAEARDRAERQASHDSLTGALTRPAFRQRFEAAAAVATPEHPLWVVLIDLDDFGRVNKRDGQLVGDRVLAGVAARIRAGIRDTDALGRLGGDEFAVLVKDNLAVAMAERLVSSIHASPVHGHLIGASAGIAGVPTHGTALELVLRAADVALRIAKSQGKARAVAFDGQIVNDVDHVERRRSVMDLWERSLIDVVLQPIVRLDDGTVHAYEALARFRHTERSDPLYWFAAADAVALRAELDLECMRAALELYPQRPPGTKLTVNVSPEALMRSDAHEVLMAAGDLGDLVLELTEEALTKDVAELKDALLPLFDRGLQLAVDDVGAGHSGLQRITALRPQYLKIDRSLVNGIEADPNKTALLDALVGYAAQTRSFLVAEGIESGEQLAVVKGLGVTFAQGHWIAKPGAPWPGVALGTAADAAHHGPLHDVQIDERVIARVPPGCPIDALHNRLTAQPQLVAAVIEDPRDGMRVVGIVTRNHVAASLGSQYGFALYARRPVQVIADRNPLTVPPGTDDGEIAKRAMARPLGTRFDPVLLVDSDGLLRGVVTIPELVTGAGRASGLGDIIISS
jgi:diguanylate cyclase (GGDEF)-like protein